MKLKKLSFASVTFIIALCLSYVIPTNSFQNESIVYADKINQKLVNFEIKPYPGTTIEPPFIQTVLDSIIQKTANYYEENGQRFVEISFPMNEYDMYISNLRIITQNGNASIDIIQGANYYIAKFPFTTNGIIDIYVESKFANFGPYKLRLDFNSKQIAATNVAVTNNYGKADVVSFKNIKKGETYKIYADQNKNTFLGEYKATGETGSITLKRPLNPNGGVLYITVTEENKFESAVTQIKYGKEQQAKAFAAKNVTITNNKGAKDKFVLKGLTKGYTYTIYSDKALKKKFYSFTADGTTKTFTKQLPTAKSGILYIVVTKSGLKPSSVTQVKYNGEPTPALAAKNVKITNKKKGIDTIKLTGLKKGTTYVIYSDAKKTKKHKTIKATKSTHSVQVHLNTKGGKVYITAQASGYSVSSTTTVSYKKAK